MFKANNDIIRSTFIWKILKEKLEEKNITMSEVAEKMKSTQPLISRSLNWKVVSSDNLFLKISKAIWLSDKEISEIFKKADQEEYAYKYNENINLLDDIDFDVALRKEFWKEIDNETISKIKEFINFVTKK